MSFSGWAPTQCIVLNQYDTGADPTSHPWCQFLQSRGDSCFSYVPSTAERANQDLRDYLTWGYWQQLSEWAKQQGYGNRYEYKYYFQSPFWDGGIAKQCGTIGAQPPGLPDPAPPSEMMIWYRGGRKYKKQTKRGKRKGRTTRRRGHKD